MCNRDEMQIRNGGQETLLKNKRIFQNIYTRSRPYRQDLKGIIVT